ncbi:hypothetical protein SAMN05444166_2793 [Singulisphaera sp. GP187]|uniref:hypothetical protein n=1 Tax=Singulisphaera sp. GP187 TaxID=1882752 RepID=UPI00092C9703|nr:hypothetical protein [Singulisphaera sp. GP187]SIO16732.1 hypothetical protein SAMN05444166_2793 [Singulisphaera sp. GP187]
MTATTPRFESLEARRVPSSFGDPAVDEPTFDSPNQTSDQALDLGDLWATPAITRHGTLSADDAGAGDVEWYRFVLDRPARVTLRLEAAQPDSSFRGALSLFNTDLDFVDFTNPQGLRRLDLAVANEGDGVAAIDRIIGPGTYNLAVSGAGNEIFSPVVAHTGLPGATGEFALSFSAIDAGSASTDGPSVLSSDPAPEASLTRAPLVIRIDLSRPLDPSTIEAGRTVQLAYSPDGTFSTEGTQVIPLADLTFSTSACELQLSPAAPLAPGFYRVVLAGTGGLGLTGVDGTPLGSDHLHLAGQDSIFRFQVVGIEGNSSLGGPANDTPAGADELGDLTSSAPIRVEGAIGDDPYYNPATPLDPNDFSWRFDLGNDVDLYHFRLNGPGPHRFAADVFAGRIGSPLGAGLRLYRRNAATEPLELLDVTALLYNLVPSSDRDFLPQLRDTTMVADLDAGDYYLAVSSGNPWGYDPSISHSNFMGGGTGPYVLNLFLSPDTSSDSLAVSPYSRIPISPPDDGEEGETSGGDRPIVGHDAPPLPNQPGTGSGISIHDPTSPGNSSAPVMIDRPPGGGTPAITPPFQNKPAAAISSSTDLSVLAFQPVGGASRIEPERATQPGRAVPTSVVVMAGSTFSSQGVALRTPMVLGLAPTVPSEVATGQVSPRLEQGNAIRTHSAGFKGIVPQTPVPWAPDPDHFDTHRPMAGSGLETRTPELNAPTVVSQPLAAAKAAERAVVPVEATAEPAPVPVPAGDDNLGTDPEAAGPAGTSAATRSEHEDRAEVHPSWKLGWALLAITGLSSLAYLRYWESFRPRWLSRASLGSDPGK